MWRETMFPHPQLENIPQLRKQTKLDQYFYTPLAIIAFAAGIYPPHWHNKCDRFHVPSQ